MIAVVPHRHNSLQIRSNCHREIVPMTYIPQNFNTYLYHNKQTSGNAHIFGYPNMTENSELVKWTEHVFFTPMPNSDNYTPAILQIVAKVLRNSGAQDPPFELNGPQRVVWAKPLSSHHGNAYRGSFRSKNRPHVIVNREVMHTLACLAFHRGLFSRDMNHDSHYAYTSFPRYQYRNNHR